MTRAIQPALFIDGEWRTTPNSTVVINPATGAELAHIAIAGSAETTDAINAASSALQQWRKTSGFERSEILQRTAILMSERAEQIGHTLSLESGKLLREAIGEVRFSADYFAWFAGEARRLEEVSSVSGRRGGPQMVVRKPVGVVASLTPWNFPISIQARKVAPALAAGCTIVARPSEQAPLAVMAFFQCLIDASIPAGVINVLNGPAGPITETLLDDDRVRAISFTGSTPVGQKLYARASTSMKRLALELGGCAPFIVCDDADLSLAVEQAMIAKFRNCGQSCIAANCFYVAENVYESFVAGLSDRIGSLHLGDPLHEETTLGPLINAHRRQELEQLHEQTLRAGFQIITQAPALPPTTDLSPDCYLPPALFATPLLDDIEPTFLEQEIFGPLTLVVGFYDLNLLMQQLTAQPLGLAGYVFSQDTTNALRVATQLEVGITGVNDGLPSAANVPMGGVKQSGLGREGGHQGIEEFLHTQYLALRSAWY
ncbi:MAG: aldehyde dehydrogenase family protein [Chloroflexi bacterium AL-W]|nr:aldehyde dehydrogenase family protein [Chloroflexi bacterium AL-N1]NOK65230.1 aldehyde dehydrogenase family protein [Chloroflexi bacterium AL-N10]NOK72505.1 aldehyde dehydrogenase family protein [Chloroflexi bacterium AL-N5]NOK79409.1 aldehyde dehydrogenase family protein [Chloroflexi bacterium AL-W]NOK87325.1 aldehyde dehydrogenase family protein [Chloroflexi bacterium AL-N15]